MALKAKEGLVKKFTDFWSVLVCVGNSTSKHRPGQKKNPLESNSRTLQRTAPWFLENSFVQKTRFYFFILLLFFFFAVSGATTEFRASQGQRIRISQKLLEKETDNNSSFCYSTIYGNKCPMFCKLAPNENLVILSCSFAEDDTELL